MQSFFSPNAKNEGAALFVTVRPNDESIMFKLLKQTGWNSTTKKGSFKKGQHVNVKVALDEAGGIIHAVRTKGEMSIYHQFDGKSVSGRFTYYEIPYESNGKSLLRKGYSLVLKKDGVDFRVGFSLGAAERLAQYLEFVLRECFIVSVAKHFAQESKWSATKGLTGQHTVEVEEKREATAVEDEGMSQDW